MEKKYIKLNDNYSHLSLGNIINIIKDESKNKTSAIQSEVFCTLFEIEYINESTVNNYCIGARSIGNEYKQIYINLNKKYQHDKNIFKPIIQNILSLIEGTIYDIDDLSLINKNSSLISITNKLYNIAKNDFYVNNETTKIIKSSINNHDYYNAFIVMLIYAVLEKKQPLYIEDKEKNVVYTILQNTDISAKELQDFLLLELNEGINFSYALKNLANTNNSFANYQLGLEYYRGEITGRPDYITAFSYIEKAAKNNHPSAYWTLAKMIIDKKIDVNGEDAIKYLNKSIDLGNVAALNSLGICYLNGIGVKKDKDKAISLFKKSAKSNYAYAFNNLAKIYESIDKDTALEYYFKSANLNESYACNKIGLYYLENQDYENAFKYFNNGINLPKRATYIWNYYNLAKHFYLNGNVASKTKKDINKAIEYFQISEELIESLIELLYIYINIFNKDKNEYNKKQVLSIIEKIENHKNYNDKYKKIVEENLNKLIINKIHVNID